MAVRDKVTHTEGWTNKLWYTFHYQLKESFGHTDFKIFRQNHGIV